MGNSVKCNTNVPNENRKNPGTIEDILKECRGVFPIFQEGINIVYNNSLSSCFQTTHTMKILPDATSSGYKFGATYIACKNLDDIDSSTGTVLSGDIDRRGNLNARIYQRLKKDIRGRFAIEFLGNKIASNQLLADYFGDSYTLSVGFLDTSYRKRSAVIICQYLQHITSNLALGAEYIHEYDKLYDSLSSFNIITKFSKFGNKVIASVGRNSVQLSYFKQIREDIMLGLEFKTNLQQRQTDGMVGYQINIPKLDTIFRGSIDTNWNVCSVLEKRLNPYPCMFSLHAMLNQKSGDFKMGFGFVID